MKNKVIIGLLLFLQTSAFCQQLTLSEAVDLALRNNEKVLQYKSKLKSKEYENLSAWGNFLPSINFQGSYNHLDDKLLIDLSPIRNVIIQLQAKNQTELANISNIINAGSALTDAQKQYIFNQTSSALNAAIPPFVETLKNQDYNSASIIGIQPLFAGGKIIAAKKYSSAEEKASRYEFEKIKNETISEVTKAYMQNLILKEIVTTRKNVLSAIKQHQKNAQCLLDQGLIAKNNLLRAEVAVAEAERNLLNDQNILELSELAIKSLISFDDSVKIELTDSLKFVEIKEPIEIFLAKAENNQPILKMIEQKKISAEQNYNAARSEFLPQIAAFGKYELYPQYLSALEPRWAVGIQAKLNIFNGFKDYLKLQNASAVEEEVDHILKGSEKNIKLWINKSFRDLKNNQAEFEKLNKTLELAEENFRQNSKRFNNGLGTSLEVIDSRLALEKVEIEISAALFNYYISLSDLENAAGESEEFLNIWNN